MISAECERELREEVGKWQALYPTISSDRVLDLMIDQALECASHDPKPLRAIMLCTCKEANSL